MVWAGGDQYEYLMLRSLQENASFYYNILYIPFQVNYKIQNRCVRSVNMPVSGQRVRIWTRWHDVIAVRGA